MEQRPEVSQGVGAGQGLGSGLSALWGLGAGVRASACGFSVQSFLWMRVPPLGVGTCVPPAG